MSVITSASASSRFRGLDYYNDNKVTNIKKISECEYESEVFGSEIYNVYLNLEKPRSSKCNCPLANGKRIICKHIVATYFAVVPGSAYLFEDEQNRLREEYEEYYEKQHENVIKYINKMSKKQLVDELIFILDYSQEWVYDNFVRNHNISGKGE